MDRLLLSEMDYAAIRYSSLGASTGEILVTLLTQPQVWIPRLFETERLAFLTDTIRHTGYGALFGGWVTLTWIPPYISHALADHRPNYSTFYHYVLEFWPAAFVAGLYFWRNVLERFPKHQLNWSILTFVLICWPMTESPAHRFRYF